MDVHPTKNGIYRYWPIPNGLHPPLWHLNTAAQQRLHQRVHVRPQGVAVADLARCWWCWWWWVAMEKSHNFKQQNLIWIWFNQQNRRTLFGSQKKRWKTGTYLFEVVLYAGNKQKPCPASSCTARRASADGPRCHAVRCRECKGNTGTSKYWSRW